MYLFVRLVYEHYKVKYNTDIPACCKIGGSKYATLEGLYSIRVLNWEKNVDCLNGVLLGQIDCGAKAGTPIIGDHMFLGTNSIIVGKIK